MGEGGRCANYIKGMDPTKYRYCAQLRESLSLFPLPSRGLPSPFSQPPLTPPDNCSAEDCDAQRATHPETDTDLRYCPSHRCPQPTCRRQKIPQGPHCATHTCSGPNCAAFCAGGGPPGAPTRYCDRHRPCSTEGCARLCHTRENGVPAAHCGLHYCRAEGCERERRGDETCVAHACAEQGCGRRRNDEVEGVFCKGHECKGTGCFFRRRRGDWCAEHVCARRGCEGEAGFGGYCERHQLCVVVGCDRYRAITGDRIHERCEERKFPIQPSPRRCKNGEVNSPRRGCPLRIPRLPPPRAAHAPLLHGTPLHDALVLAARHPAIDALRNAQVRAPALRGATVRAGAVLRCARVRPAAVRGEGRGGDAAVQGACAVQGRGVWKVGREGGVLWGA